MSISKLSIGIVRTQSDIAMMVNQLN